MKTLLIKILLHFAPSIALWLLPKPDFTSQGAVRSFLIEAAHTYGEPFVQWTALTTWDDKVLNLFQSIITNDLQWNALWAIWQALNSGTPPELILPDTLPVDIQDETKQRFQILKLIAERLQKRFGTKQ